jgi:hypothetical protein
MPTSTLLRASFFALGAAVGGGAVAVLNASKKQANATQVGPPLVEVGVTGDPRFSARATTAVGPVLKHGNPGTTWPSPCPFVAYSSTVRRSRLRPARAPGIRGCV